MICERSFDRRVMQQPIITERGAAERLVSVISGMLAMLFLQSVAHGATVPATDDPDYATHGFAWEHNELGLDDTVAPGFRSVEHDDGVVRVTGREYHFGNALLPRRIVSAGVPLLSSPMTLLLESPDVTGEPTEQTSRVVSSRDDGVTIENTSRSSSRDITATFEIGVDGFVKVDVVITPKMTLRIDRLAIVAKLPSEHAASYDRYLAYDFDSQRVDRHDLLDSVGTIDGERVFGFSPSVWVGDDGVGLEFIAETNAHHHLRDTATAHRLSDDGTTVTLVNTLVDERVELDEPYAFSFALLATPVVRQGSRPRTTLLTSRQTRTDRSGTFDELYIGHWRRDRMPLPGIPTPAPEGTADRRQHDAIRERLDNASMPYLPYAALHLMPSTLPELDDYRAAWSAAPARRGSPLWTEKLGTSKPVQPVSLDSRSIQDFVLHTHVREIEERGIGGIYFDVAAPDTLEDTTARYLRHHPPLDEKATVVFLPVFAHREFLLRYWKATKAISPDFAIVHHGNHFPRYVLALIDFAVFGEGAHALFEKSPMTPKVGRASGRVELNYRQPENYVPEYLSLPSSVIPGNRSDRDSAAHVLLPQIEKFNGAFLEENDDLHEHWTRGALATWLLNDFRIWNTRIRGKSVARLLRALSRFEGFANAAFSGPRPVADGVDLSSYSTSRNTLQVYVNRNSDPITIALRPTREGRPLPTSIRSIESNRAPPRPEAGHKNFITIPGKDFLALLLQND